MDNLTKRQQELFNFLVETIKERGLPPTLSEIGRALKIKSKNATVKLLRALEERGYIERDSSPRGIKIKEIEGISLNKGFVSLPLIGAVAAGTPMLAEENIEDWINLPATLVKSKKNVFLLRVFGESMKNAGIFNNDIVIVRKTEIRPNDIVVALLEGEATVKRLVKRGSEYYLKAENPSYRDIYPTVEGLIQGKVVGVIRQME